MTYRPFWSIKFHYILTSFIAMSKLPTTINNSIHNRCVDHCSTHLPPVWYRYVMNLSLFYHLFQKYQRMLTLPLCKWPSSFWIQGRPLNGYCPPCHQWEDTQHWDSLPLLLCHCARLFSSLLGPSGFYCGSYPLPTKIILFTLQELGVSGTALYLFTSYLKDHTWTFVWSL